MGRDRSRRGLHHRLAAYAISGGVLIGSDVASYSSGGAIVSDLECEDTLDQAEAAGSTVECVGPSGFRSEDIDVLDAFLGLSDGDNISKQVVRVSTADEA